MSGRDLEAARSRAAALHEVGLLCAEVADLEARLHLVLTVAAQAGTSERDLCGVTGWSRGRVRRALGRAT